MSKIVRHKSGVKTYFDADISEYVASVARKPYYRLRGKPVTEEQAFEIIRCTDTFFSHYLNMLPSDGFEDCIGDSYFEVDWFSAYLFDNRHGWIHPNGTVGANYFIPYKYPEIIEYWNDLALLVKKFPYLDFIIAISHWDEISPKRWESREFTEDVSNIDKYSLVDFEREGFEATIHYGVYVHDGVIEFLNTNNAISVYEKYVSMYEAEDTAIYMESYYRMKQPDVVDYNYLTRCLQGYGINDPESFLEYKMNLGDYHASEIKNALCKLSKGKVIPDGE